MPLETIFEADFVAVDFVPDKSIIELYFFNSAVQFMITVGGGAVDSPTNVPIKNL